MAERYALTLMLQSEQSTPRAADAGGQRYAVWLGALVTGFCTYGAACWITQLSATEMRLMLAGPAVLAPDRLRSGRKIVMHISHRTGETWRILPIRAAVIGADGNFFTARLLEPGPAVIEELLRALIAEGRAKPRPTNSRLTQVRANLAAPAVTPAVTPSAAPATPPAREVPAHLLDTASRCRAIALDLGTKWALALMDGLDTRLFARLSDEKEKPAQQQLDECYLSFVMAREKLVSEIAIGLAAQAEGALDPDLYGGQDGPQGPASAVADLTATIGLMEALDSPDLGGLRKDAPPCEPMRRWERELARLTDAPVTEANDPVGLVAVCALATETVLRHWPSGANVRTLIHDALADSAQKLDAFYEGLAAGLADTSGASKS
ncbi:MAG: hypothetical protein NFCOHLIN_01941 [Gammaproteobacteria bacterium]|nr:hypothetical protein [Gammaproteobacteria bacterium]